MLGLPVGGLVGTRVGVWVGCPVVVGVLVGAPSKTTIVRNRITRWIRQTAGSGSVGPHCRPVGARVGTTVGSRVGVLLGSFVG